MTAVLGLDPQIIEDICKKTADETNSVVSVANYNLSLIHISDWHEKDLRVK